MAGGNAPEFIDPMPEDLWIFTLSDWALAQLPFLRIPFEQKFDYFGDEQPGPHLLFEDIVVPYVVAHAADPAYRDKVVRIFAVAEEIAAHPDPEIHQIMDVSFAETFVGNYPSLPPEVWSLMGERVRGLTKVAAVRLGIEAR